MLITHGDLKRVKLIKTGGEVDKREKKEKLDVIIILQTEQN